jgi:tetratricopeptide (TPR) repeat protein
MIRCSHCGLRLLESQPICAVHGPAKATVADEPPVGGQPLDFELPGYRVREVLGRGGFGVVYRGEREDGRPVAIKVGHPEQIGAAERLTREREALEKVGTPFAPELFDHGMVDGRAYVAMECVASATLASLLAEQGGPLPLGRVRSYALAILDAVERVHTCSLVHRDLKPENIFVDGAGAKLIDFGLVAAMSRGPNPTGPTIVDSSGAPAATTDDGMGTPEYMSPEQCEARPTVDARTDIYAFGVILYEMLGGAPPFFGAAADVQESHRSRRPPYLVSKVSISAELEDVVLRCLAKQPERRFASVAELRVALGRASFADAPGAETPEPAPVPPPARERRPVGLVFFESASGLAAVQQTLTTLGGQLAQASGAKYVAVFGHELGDNAGRSAMLAGQGLVHRKMCAKVLVDVAQVLIQTRPDGGRRFISPLFTRKDHFPQPNHPEGVTMTRAAAEVMPDVPTAPVPGSEELFTFDLTSGSRELTAMWLGTGGLVGRDSLVSLLVSDGRLALTSSKPGIATVEAEAGYGKSHLASVLAQHLEELPTAKEVMAVAAQEAIGGAVNQTLRDMLHRVLDLPAAPPPDSGRQLLTERLGEHVGGQVWAAVALVLGWVPADHPEVANLSAAPGALRSAAARALGEALRIRARKKPLAIVFDDAHLADTATLDALEYATLEEGGAPVWVCALARPSLLRGRPTWGARTAHATQYPLGPLDEESASTLARRLLAPAENVSNPALSRLFERTQGIPRLLVELIRGLKRDGIVRRIERGTSYYLATEELDNLPDLPIVQWSASREVEALPAQLAAHARLASVLGSKFGTAEVDRVLEILEREHGYRDTDLDGTVGIQRLIEAGLLVRHRTGKIDFRHALLRDTVYQSVPSALRSVIHRAAFRMYETSAELDRRDALPRLALHAAHSGLGREAASLYLELAEQAQQAHSYIDAEHSFDAALTHLTDPVDERVSVAVRGRALMRFRAGRCDDAFKDFDTARERAQKKGDVVTEIDVLLDQAEIMDWLGDYGRSATLVQEARRLASAIVSDSVGARLTLAVGRVHYRSGQPEKALLSMKEAALMAEEMGEAGYPTLVVSLLLAVPSSVQLERLEEAEEMLARVIDVCSHHGDYHHLAAAINNRMFISLARRQTDRMMEDLQRVLEISREVGFPQIEMYTRNNLGECCFFEGQFEAAVVHTRRAVDLCERIGSGVSYLGITLTLLARIELYRGNTSEALALTERVRVALANAAATDASARMTPGDEVLLRMVELSVRSGDDAAWDELFEFARLAPSQPYEMVELFEARARAVAQSGDRERCRALLEEALDLAQHSAVSVAGRVARNLAAHGKESELESSQVCVASESLRARDANRTTPPPAPISKIR